MANPQRGEVAIEIDGTLYTFAAGINTLAAIEGALSGNGKRVTWLDAIREVNAGSITHVRVFMWAMLQRHHRGLTPEAVGDLIDRVGLETINEKFAEILRASYPDPEVLKALGVNVNPPTAQDRNGTGASSSSASEPRPGWAATRSGSSRSKKSSKNSSSRVNGRKPLTGAIG